MEKPQISRVVGSNKAKEPKQDIQRRLTSPIPERREPLFPSKLRSRRFLLKIYFVFGMSSIFSNGGYGT